MNKAQEKFKDRITEAVETARQRKLDTLLLEIYDCEQHLEDLRGQYRRLSEPSSECEHEWVATMSGTVINEDTCTKCGTTVAY